MVNEDDNAGEDIEEQIIVTYSDYVEKQLGKLKGQDMCNFLKSLNYRPLKLYVSDVLDKDDTFPKEVYENFQSHLTECEGCKKTFEEQYNKWYELDQFQKDIWRDDTTPHD